jgi:Phasin protein
MQAQADLLDLYRSIINAATETLKVALRDMERLNEQQLKWVRAALEQNDRLTNRLAEVRSIDDLFLAQSQFAFSQVTQGIEVGWRLFRAIQDSQLAAMSRIEAQVRQATQTARRTYDLAIQTMQDASSMAFSPASTEPPSAEKRATAWSGAERRKASVVPFPGPERRKTA